MVARPSATLQIGEEDMGASQAAQNSGEISFCIEQCPSDLLSLIISLDSSSQPASRYVEVTTCACNIYTALVQYDMSKIRGIS